MTDLQQHQQYIENLEAELEDACAEQDRLRSLNTELLVALGDLADSVGGLDGEYPQMKAPLAEARLLIARAVRVIPWGGSPVSCPTCSATMEGIGYGMFHCPRCGTLLNCPHDGCVSVPALVARCRKFGKGLFCDGLRDKHATNWKRLGIAESIHLPADRPEANA